MADNSEQQPFLSGRFGFTLIAIGSASLVVTVYHLIVICWQNSAEEARRRRHRQPTQALSAAEEGGLVSHQIPSHRYEMKNKKGVQDCEDGDGETCAVCLGDFEEGDELRTMPSCKHSFHVPCIDMWLVSHSSCPVCRANATPSPVVPREVGSVASAEVQITVVQNGLPLIR